MKKRMDYTPNSRIVNAIRQLWLRSRERSMAVKLAGNTCMDCGRKGSVAKGREVKIQVHHRAGIDWHGIAQMVRDRVLQTPAAYDVLCKECHDKRHPEGPTSHRTDNPSTDKRSGGQTAGMGIYEAQK